MTIPPACRTSLNNALSALSALPALAASLNEIEGLIEIAIAAGPLEALAAFTALAAALRAAWALAQKISASAASALNNAISCVSQLIGGLSMACTTTHSAKAQGPGLCCQQVSNGTLVLPPGTTTLPVFTPGSELTFPHVSVTDSGGHCGTCMIVGSRSRNHPGLPVLRYVRGGPGCPSTRTGCCALAVL